MLEHNTDEYTKFTSYLEKMNIFVICPRLGSDLVLHKQHDIYMSNKELKEVKQDHNRDEIDEEKMKVMFEQYKSEQEKNNEEILSQYETREIVSVKVEHNEYVDQSEITKTEDGTLLQQRSITEPRSLTDNQQNSITDPSK